MQYLQLTPSPAPTITLEELYRYHAERDDRRHARRAWLRTLVAWRPDAGSARAARLAGT